MKSQTQKRTTETFRRSFSRLYLFFFPNNRSNRVSFRSRAIVVLFSRSVVGGVSLCVSVTVRSVVCSFMGVAADCSHSLRIKLSCAVGAGRGGSLIFSAVPVCAFSRVRSSVRARCNAAVRRNSSAVRRSDIGAGRVVASPVRLAVICRSAGSLSRAGTLNTGREDAGVTAALCRREPYSPFIICVTSW